MCPTSPPASSPPAARWARTASRSAHWLSWSARLTQGSRTPQLQSLLRHRQWRVLNAGDRQLLPFVVCRHYRVTDLHRSRRPAHFAVLGHGAGEAGLVGLHHRCAVIEVLSADSVHYVIAVGIDRLFELAIFLVGERPRRFVELERRVLGGLGNERR